MSMQHEATEIYATKPTPVLNTPDFSFAFGGTTGTEIPLDKRGLPFYFEFVALPGTPFQLIQQMSPFISKVLCPSYSHTPLYIDTRFIYRNNLKNREFGKEEAQIFVSGASDIAYGQDATDSSGCFGITPGKKALCPPMPSKELILERMERRIGTPYIWGGNWGAGIPELIHYYPPKGEIDLLTQQLWILQGVDCSGLLYEATRGATPRNTSSLIYYGKQLNNNDLQPLDMVVYPGHVFFVLDSHTAIESRLGRGVIRSDLKARMEELRQTRTQVPEWKPDLDPAKHFVIRRL